VCVYVCVSFVFKLRRITKSQELVLCVFLLGGCELGCQFCHVHCN